SHRHLMHKVFASRLLHQNLYTQNISVVRIAYHSVQKTVIFSTTGSTKTDFGPQLKSLAKERFTVVGWDPRGDAKDAVDLMKTLGFGKFSLLGWSDGGITALVAAARNPDLINKMVVWGANAFVSQQDLKLYNGVSRFIALDKWQVIRATNWLSLEYVRVVCLCVNGYVVGTLRGA
uniref:Biphenyl hydrolase like n=1 Tax=Maylandia zebra TaxID=106582 RepID=A0A3P9CKE3_9CICH